MNSEAKERIEAVASEANPSMDTSSALSSEKKQSQLLSSQPQTESAAMISDKNLDRLLSDLAQEVPPMPDSFCRNWRQVIRHENDSVQASSGKTSIPISTIPMEKDPSVPNADNVNQLHSRITVKLHWRRFLDVAAIMLFLLGGTMLAAPSLFVFSRQISPSPLVFSPMPTSIQAETAAFEMNVEAETAHKAAGEEEAILESSSEADMAFDADISIEAGNQEQSGQANQYSAEAFLTQDSFLSQSASTDGALSGSTSGLDSEDTSTVPETFIANSTAQEKRSSVSHPGESKSFASTFSLPVQVLGSLLLILALLLFFLRRRI